ncbi:MAG: acyl-CoA dehydrogenase family protein, partial [Chloroflexota bacterium]|nr:acyl-CoA dehydrogenase family protein [Chloroflexota bacterium]
MKKGGAFVVDYTLPAEVFTPEDFKEAHRMLINTTDSFIKNEVRPRIPEIERKEFEVTRRLMRKAGEIGLLGSDIEE